MDRDPGAPTPDPADGPERVWDPEAGRYVAPDEIVTPDDTAGVSDDTPPEPAPAIPPMPAPEPDAAVDARPSMPTWAVALLSAAIGAVVALVVVLFLPDDDEPQPADPSRGATALTASSVVTELRHTVVNVFGEERADGRRRSGSGVVLTPDGTIVTSARLVDGQETIGVAFANGTIAPAEVLGTDDFWDLAFLDVDLENIHALQRSSAEFVDPGDEVVSISSPEQTYTSVGIGVVSSVGRPFEDSSGITRFDMLKIGGDAGSSSTLVSNMGAEAVGITWSGRDSADAGGYALPIDIVWAAFDRVVERRAVTHPWIGLVTTPIGPEARVLGDARGLLAVLVFRNSPAAQAGLRPGDFVVAVDDEEAEGNLLLLSKLLEHGVGGEVEISFLRGGELGNVTVEIAELPSARPPDQEG